jgi:hypothetical protein
MAGEFEKFFGALPDVCARNDDATICMNSEHRDVQELLNAIKQCRSAGFSEQAVLRWLASGFREAAKRKQKSDGR